VFGRRVTDVWSKVAWNVTISDVVRAVERGPRLAKAQRAILNPLLPRIGIGTPIVAQAGAERFGSRTRKDEHPGSVLIPESPVEGCVRTSTIAYLEGGLDAENGYLVDLFGIPLMTRRGPKVKLFVLEDEQGDFPRSGRKGKGERDPANITAKECPARWFFFLRKRKTSSRLESRGGHQRRFQFSAFRWNG